MLSTKSVGSIGGICDVGFRSISQIDGKAMIKDWILDGFRITTFFSQSISWAEHSWYEKVTGAPPETTEIRRAEGVRVDTGEITGARYTLTATEVRADWNVSFEPGDEKGLFEGIGSAENLHERIQYFRPWLSELINVNRLALGLVAKIPSKGKVEAYEVLSKLLPAVKLDAENSSEFVYRINRPRRCMVRDLEMHINRLSSWKALQIRRVSHQLVQGSDVANVSSGIISPVGLWATCELDINTDAARVEKFKSDILWEIQELLVSNALEILDKGDIA